jgi:hypothetical protein
MQAGSVACSAVCHCTVVTAAESLAVGLAQIAGKMRMPVFVAIVDVGPAVILEVAAGTFHPVPESLPLHIVELIRKSVPLWRRRWGRRYGRPTEPRTPPPIRCSMAR